MRPLRLWLELQNEQSDHLKMWGKLQEEKTEGSKSRLLFGHVDLRCLLDCSGDVK